MRRCCSSTVNLCTSTWVSRLHIDTSPCLCKVRLLDKGHRAEASVVSPPNGAAFQRIARSARATIRVDGLIVAPYLVVGGTDRYLYYAEPASSRVVSIVALCAACLCTLLTFMCFCVQQALLGAYKQHLQVPAGSTEHQGRRAEDDPR